VIYGGVEGENITYTGLAQALAQPGSEVRLFGKPLSHERRRMGVALARGKDLDTARRRARDTAAKVRPQLNPD
jgi:phosphoribosylglycinamide formyltransferase 2